MTALPAFGTLPDNHLVPDLLGPGLKLVFCGTALGRKSAEARAYYANPTNMFWRALHEVGLTPALFRPDEYPRLLEHGIGLTDLCKEHFGNDADLPPVSFDAAGLREKIVACQPAILAFTSKKAASAFLLRPTGRIMLGEQHERIGYTRLFVLCSPSGAARGRWRRAVWDDLAHMVAQLT